MCVIVSMSLGTSWVRLQFCLSEACLCSVLLTGTAVVFLSWTVWNGDIVFCWVCGLEKDTDCGSRFAYRGAAVPLHSLWESLQPEERAASAHEEAHWRASLPLWLLCHGLHTEEQHEITHEASAQLCGDLAGSHGGPGTGWGGAKDPPLRGSGAGGSGWMADANQCVLMPRKEAESVLCEAPREDESTWRFCSETSSVKNLPQSFFS